MKSSHLYQTLLISAETTFFEDIWRALRNNGHLVKRTKSAYAGWRVILETSPDLIILQADLPDKDGIALCKALRKYGYRMPILILSCDSLSRRIEGLNAGADGCLDSGATVSELLARVKILLRSVEDQRKHIFTFADLRLDLHLREVHRGNRTVKLSRLEFDLLSLFVSHPGQVLDKDRIIMKVWGYDYEPSSNVLEVYIHQLRRKLGQPNLIATMRYVGYVLREPTLISG